MDVLIKRYRDSEVNGLALLHQLAQSLELHLELKETGTSGKLLQLISALKISPLIPIHLFELEIKADTNVWSVHILRRKEEFRDMHVYI